MSEPSPKLRGKAVTDASPNFGFLLDGHDPVFHRLALSAEQAAFIDPNTTLLKLRQLGEAFAQHAAATFGVWAGPQMGQLDLLRALEARRYIEGETAQLFHHLRRHGNAAAHDFAGSRQEAVDQLRLARRLAIWFHRTFGGIEAQKFKPGPFVAPEDPSARVRALEEELVRARAEAETHRTAANEARRLSELEAQRRAAAEDAARKADAERAEWEQLAAATEQDSQAKEAAFRATLAKLQEEAARKPEQEKNVQAGRAAQAAAQLDLDEAETRLLIDDQLRAAGWEADSRRLRYGLGTRPEQGRRLAIAEWPTDSGPADYVLFDGTTPLGVVEAKRKRKNVVAAIDQGKRYALDFQAAGTTLARLEGWPAFLNEPGRYLVPFIYATNGRPYLRQVETESGIWFLDARQPTNHPRALDGWHTPDGLRAMLAEDLVSWNQRVLTNYAGRDLR